MFTVSFIKKIDLFLLKYKITEHHTLCTHQSTQAIDFSLYPLLYGNLKRPLCCSQKEKCKSSEAFQVLAHYRQLGFSRGR